MGMFFTICIFLILFLIAWIDGKTKRIPDRLLAVLLAAEICAVPFFPEIEMAERGMGILCVSVPLLMLNLIRPGAFGGGDIKLSAVSGMFLGWRRMADAFLLALFMAGGYAFRLLAGKKKGRRDCFAFGPFLCMGIMTAFFMIFMGKLPGYLYKHVSCHM